MSLESGFRNIIRKYHLIFIISIFLDIFRYFYYFNSDNCLEVYIGSFVGKSRWIDSREKKITLQDFRYPDRKLPLVRHTFRKITLFPRVRIKCLTTLFFHLFHPPRSSRPTGHPILVSSLRRTVKRRYRKRAR